MREITRGEFFLGLLVAILILFFRASQPLDPDWNSSTYNPFNAYLNKAGVASTEHVQGIDEWSKQCSDEGAWNSPWRAKEYLPNFYAVLGVDPKVTDSDLEEVYARLLQEHAPGAVAGDIHEESVKPIREAFGILHSHYHRCEYDHLKDIREGKWEALRAPVSDLNPPPRIRKETVSRRPSWRAAPSKRVGTLTALEATIADVVKRSAIISNS